MPFHSNVPVLFSCDSAYRNRVALTVSIDGGKWRVIYLGRHFYERNFGESYQDYWIFVDGLNERRLALSAIKARNEGRHTKWFLVDLGKWVKRLAEERGL